MKVILLQDVPALGRRGEVKDASDGYARNFLLPRGLAMSATPAAVAALAGEKARREHEQSKQAAVYQASAEKLNSTPIEIKTKVGEKGKAFGSITAAKIRDALAKHGVAVEKEWVVLDEPIKTIGEHSVEIKFPHGVVGTVKLTVHGE